MWTLSENAIGLLHQLDELSGSKSWLGRSKREGRIQDLLDELTASNEPGAWISVCRYLLASSDGVRNAARNAMGKLMLRLEPFDLIQLSNSFARAFDGSISESWERLAPSDVADAAGSPSDTSYSALLGLLSFHRNGFVRHEAVRALTERSDGGELPFLLIRQNDWVEPIALDAQAAVTERIKDSYVSHLARSLRLILHLATFNRRDHRGILLAIVQLLLEEKHFDLLRSVVECSEREVRRQVVRYGLERSGEQQARLIAIGIASHDPIVRLQCCGHLASAYEGNHLRSVLEKLETDDFTPIRRAVLCMKADRFPELAIESWRHALLDSNRSIRELARHSLAKRGVTEVEVAAIYRDVVARQSECLTALEGLAETGDWSDMRSYQEMLHHSLPSRRVVAIRGVCRVGKESAVSEVLPLLWDGSPSVVREVRKSVGPNSQSITGDELLSVALKAEGFFARRNAVEMLAELGKWRSIAYLLAVASDADDATASFAESKVQNWLLPPKCNKIFTRPTPNEAAEIRAVLGKTKGRVSEVTLALVNSGLVQFG